MSLNKEVVRELLAQLQTAASTFGGFAFVALSVTDGVFDNDDKNDQLFAWQILAFVGFSIAFLVAWLGLFVVRVYVDLPDEQHKQPKGSHVEANDSPGRASRFAIAILASCVVFILVGFAGLTCVLWVLSPKYPSREVFVKVLAVVMSAGPVVFCFAAGCYFWRARRLARKKNTARRRHIEKVELGLVTMKEDLKRGLVKRSMSEQLLLINERKTKVENVLEAPESELLKLPKNAGEAIMRLEVKDVEPLVRKAVYEMDALHLQKQGELEKYKKTKAEVRQDGLKWRSLVWKAISELESTYEKRVRLETHGSKIIDDRKVDIDNQPWPNDLKALARDDDERWLSDLMTTNSVVWMPEANSLGSSDAQAGRDKAYESELSMRKQETFRDWERWVSTCLTLMKHAETKVRWIDEKGDEILGTVMVKALFGCLLKSDQQAFRDDQVTSLAKEMCDARLEIETKRVKDAAVRFVSQQNCRLWVQINQAKYTDDWHKIVDSPFKSDKWNKILASNLRKHASGNSDEFFNERKRGMSRFIEHQGARTRSISQEPIKWLSEQLHDKRNLWRFKVASHLDAHLRGQDTESKHDENSSVEQSKKKERVSNWVQSRKQEIWEVRAAEFQDSQFVLDIKATQMSPEHTEVLEKEALQEFNKLVEQVDNEDRSWLDTLHERDYLQPTTDEKSAQSKRRLLVLRERKESEGFPQLCSIPQSRESHPKPFGRS